MISFRNYVFPLIIFGILVAIPICSNDQYYLYILSRIFIWATMATSLFLAIRTGLFNLGHAAFMGMGAYTSALLVTRGGMSFWLSLPVAAIFTMGAAFLIGMPILRLKGMYYVLVTSILCEVLILTIGTFPEFTGGYNGIYGIPSPILFGIDFSNKVALYYLILIFFVLSIFICYRIWHSQIGKILKGIADDPVLCESIGIPVTVYKIMIFAVASCFASFSGSLIILLNNTIDPMMFSTVASVNAFLYLVLGGAGSIFGPVIGAFVAILIEEIFRFLLNLTPILFGIIVICVVIFFPGGLITLRPLLIFNRNKTKSQKRRL